MATFSSTGGLQDVDKEISECLQRCTGLEEPLLDANVLEELCLSDELFVDLPFLSMVHAGLNNGATEPKDQAKECAVSCSNATQSYDNSPVSDVFILKSGETITTRPTYVTSRSGIQDVQMKFQTPVKQEHTGGGCKRPHPTSDETVLSKRQQRMIKNRESACISRLRKKEYVTTLEDRLKEASLKNAALLNENTSLRSHVSILEEENEQLRVHVNGRGIGMQKPVVLMAVIFCFALFMYTRHIPPSSLPGDNLVTTSLSKLPGRALLSVEPVQYSSALTAMSTAVSTLSSVQAISKFQHRKINKHKKDSPQVVCSCPSQPDKRFNSSNVERTHRQVSRYFKEYEANFVTRASTPSSNSLAVLNPSYMTLGNDFNIHLEYSEESQRMYKLLKKRFARDLNRFHLISFKDHILLDAPHNNISQYPRLMVLVPAFDSGSSENIMPMLQIDCDIMDLKVVNFETL